MAAGAEQEKFAHRRRAGRRQDRGRRLRQGRRQGLRPRRRDGAQVAGDRPRHRLEGLRRARRDLGRAAEGGAEAAVSDARARGAGAAASAAPASPAAPGDAAAVRTAASIRPRRARCCRWRARSPSPTASMVALRHAGAARRLAGAHLERRHALPLQGVDRLAGRGRGVPARRRDVPVRRLRAVDPRPRRHRGGVDAALDARRRAAPRRASTCSASPSAPSSRGSRGRCCTRPGSTSRRPRRRGRRRSGFPTC